MTSTLASETDLAADFNVERVDILGCGTSKTPPILQDIHLTVKGGEMCGILGASGAGKTTLLRAIVLRPTLHQRIRAHSTWNQERMTVSWLRQHAAFVPTDTGHLPSLWTVAETLRYYDTHHDGIESVTSSLDLGECLHSFVRDLSTGQAKRMMLASAVLQHSHLICLDEPTSGLSDSDALQMMRCCVAMQQQRPLTLIVMVLHQPRDAIFRLLDRVILVNRGSLVWNGSVPHLESHLRQLGIPSPHPLLLASHVADHWDKLPILNHDTPRGGFGCNRQSSWSCLKTLPYRKGLRDLLPNWWRWDRRLWFSFLCHAVMLLVTVALLSAIFRSDMFPLAIMRRAQIMYTSLPLHVFFIVAFKRELVGRESAQRALDIYGCIASPLRLWVVAGWASWIYTLLVSTGIVFITRRVDGWVLDHEAEATHVLLVFLCVRCTLALRNVVTHIGTVRQWSPEIPMYICTSVHLIAEGTNGIFVQASDLPSLLQWIPWLNPLYYANAAVLTMELGELYDSDFDSHSLRVLIILCGILSGLNGYWLLVMELGSHKPP